MKTIDVLRHVVPSAWLPRCDQVERVILHWTAGRPYPTLSDRLRYHLLIDRDGSLHRGMFPIGRWPPHTHWLNTGSVAIALCGMIHAQPTPFTPGPAPITAAQVKALAEAAAAVLSHYELPLTEWTCLTHCEVPFVYGLPQRGKWDISWLPDMPHPMLHTVGGHLRGLTHAALERLAEE